MNVDVGQEKQNKNQSYLLIQLFKQLSFHEQQK